MSEHTIYKYPLESPGALTQLLVPFGAKILTAQFQNDRLVLWAQCVPGYKPVKRTFEVVGTGWDFEAENWHYIATCQDRQGYVWHVFEVTA